MTRPGPAAAPGPAPIAAPLPGQVDRPVLGLVLMLGFCVLAPASDATAKALAMTIPVLQLVAIRFAVQASMLVPLVAAMGRDWRMSALGWRLTLLRTALQIAGIYLMTMALIHLPLADAIAIAFVMPFILLLLGAVVLGETVGPRRLIACGVGFGGTLLVMQPNLITVGWPVIYPLAVAFVFAIFILVTRRLAREADPITMQAASGLIGLLALVAAYVVLPRHGPMALVAPGDLWPLMLLMGALGTGGHLMMTWSLRHAPAATLAPLQYVEIPVAALIGLMVFDDVPDPVALLGIAVTVAAGLYVLWRESRA
ncbi:carboxylate/amino acid/amine transporter [Jannaschia seosinensis]|uniref:Carboxylate/amino acid/amine transporter n=1 Tax=Jannaschia seosinensis TaxID=313367 RepID=A0A0M7BG76_9RHOB|nr:DMT family transporter [Jannaschia seosinensis]CUH40903.1 carboxylate/amino acid/amine transporter [Jannaschia seosinensis]